MKEIETGKGLLKFRKPNIFELTKLQHKLTRIVVKDSDTASLSVDEYCIEAAELMKNHFDFSLVEGVSCYEEAIQDYECANAMMKLSLGVIEDIGELIKKKNLSEMVTTPTPNKSKKKS